MVTRPTDPTLAAYAAHGPRWASSRSRARTDEADPEGFRALVAAGSASAADEPDTVPRILDLGCGHGPDLDRLGEQAIGLDASRTMLDLARTTHPNPLVEADVRRLPIRPGSLDGVWANRSLVHLHREQVPAALWQLHRALRVGAPLRAVLFEGDDDHATFEVDPLPGRRFSRWPRELLTAVLEGAGFEQIKIEAIDDGDHLRVTAIRGRRLADSVAGHMSLLIAGLNPSWYAADAGVGFARPGNRFWPALEAAGLCDASASRRPDLLLERFGIGMTDLVKRPTAAAREVGAEEFRAGAARLERLVVWLQPRVVCVVGITGWRHAVDPSARLGWQPAPFGGRPVYVMHNPSGLNAHATIDSIAAALAEAADGP